MKTVIFTDNYSRVKQYTADKEGEVYFLSIGITSNIQMVRKQIIDQGMADRFVEEKFWIKRDIVGSDYAKAVDILTEKNRSFDWWAYNFVSKSPIATELFDKVAWSIVILNFILKGGMKDADVFIILTNDHDIFCQVKAALKDSCEVLFKGIKKINLREVIKNAAPLSPVLFFLNKIFSKIIAFFMFRESAQSSDQYKYVFLSLLNQQSFSDKTHSYKDFYFSPLLEHLSKSNNRCLNLVLVWAPYAKNLNRLKQCYPISHDVLPLECFLHFSGLTKVFAKILSKVFLREKIQGDFCVQGYSFLELLKKYKRKEEFSSSLFLSMLLFHVGREIASHFPGAKVIYPFENRAFERMFIKGIKETAPDMKLFGYQHAALTKRHLNYFLGENERKYMPLPDRIVTTGEVPKNILQEFFGHSREKLIVGNSLRRNPLNINNRLRPVKIKDILVIISTDLDEYKRVLLFLEEFSRIETVMYNIVIRPHPVIPLASALKDLPELSFPLNEQSSAVPLDEALYGADLVLFASSTVSVEALSAGVPIIYLDVSPFLNNNPLGFYPSRCEVVSSPEELVEVLDRLSGRNIKFDDGKKYVDSYLSKRNELLFEQILEGS